ncbi:MAG: class I SAM-dependent methyltransferase [Nitrospira sp.]|nr:class I SAM-dependent methyltransferase [Nitrospira sp.]
MSLRDVVVGQFQKSHGVAGHIAGWIMAHRPSNRDRNRWTVNLLDIKAHDRILEIGCGPGLALEDCLARAIQGYVVGLDHSQTMLEQARKRNARAVEEGRLQLRLGRLEELESKNEQFDKIFSVNVVQFLDNPATTFQMLSTKLEPGGFLATTYMPRDRNPSRSKALVMAQAVKQYMEEAGFIQIRTDMLPLEPVPAICVIGKRPCLP